MSTAKAAPTILAIVLLVIPFYRAMRWSDRVAIPFFSLAVLVLGAALLLTITNAEQMLGSIGRDMTLTGRTNYWPLMIDKALERPWWGYGYNGLWFGGWKGEIADVWQFLRAGDEPPHPHNGFLFIWLNIGLVGLVVLAMQGLTTGWRALRWLRSVPTAAGLVPIAYLTLLILFNLTETMLMQPDIIWILYVTLSLSMTAEPLDDQGGVEEMRR